MSKYEVLAHNDKWIIRRTRYASLCIIDEYFAGYDFMGSADWINGKYGALTMEKEEAEQIVSDLEAADEDNEKPTALEIVLQAAQERLDSLNAHGCVDKDLEDAIRTLTATIDY